MTDRQTKAHKERDPVRDRLKKRGLLEREREREREREKERERKREREREREEEGET